MEASPKENGWITDLQAFLALLLCFALVIRSFFDPPRCFCHHC